MNTTDTQTLTNPAQLHPGDFVRVTYTDGTSYAGVIRPVEILPGKVDLYVVSKGGGFTPLQVAKNVNTGEPEWNSHVVPPVERPTVSVGAEPGLLDSTRDLRDGMRLAVRVLGTTMYGTVTTDEAGVMWLQKDSHMTPIILRLDDDVIEWTSAIRRVQVISPTTLFQKESTTMSTTDTAVATSPGPLPADGEYTLHGPLKPHNAIVKHRSLFIEGEGWANTGTYNTDVTLTWNRHNPGDKRWWLTPGNNNTTTTEKESTTMSTTDTETTERTLTPEEIKPGQRVRLTYKDNYDLPPCEVTVGRTLGGRLVGVVDGHDVEDGEGKIIFAHDDTDAFAQVIESVTLLRQPGEEASAAELRSVIEGKDELIRSLEERVQSAHERVRAADSRHQQDIATIGAALREEAENRDWCREYDEVVDRINGDLYHELPIRARRVTFTVTRTWTVTATCTGSPQQAEDESFIESSLTATDDDVEMDHEWEDVESYSEDTTVTDVHRADS